MPGGRDSNAANMRTRYALYRYSSIESSLMTVCRRSAFLFVETLPEKKRNYTAGMVYSKTRCKLRCKFKPILGVNWGIFVYHG